MVEEFNHDRNFMFERVAAEFLSVIQDNSRPSCTIEDGVKVLEIVEAIRRSQLLGQSTRVNEEKDVS
jgi:predicted dehydrogenase